MLTTCGLCNSKYEYSEYSNHLENDCDYNNIPPQDFGPEVDKVLLEMTREISIYEKDNLFISSMLKYMDKFQVIKTLSLLQEICNHCWNSDRGCQCWNDE